MLVRRDAKGNIEFIHEGKKIELFKKPSSERFDLRKMNPDTQKVLPQLKEKFPKLEQLFDAMIIKDYESQIVQQQLQELSLLPKNLIDKIRQKNIVFFISNE